MLQRVAESFVDLTYRGLSLGRRIKLTQVRPSTGYLEHPTPMPVGTKLVVTTDEGVTFEAVVTHVHEQVAGSEKLPGMIVKPVTEGSVVAWWNERVTLPEAEPPRTPERGKPMTVRPRTHTVPTPPPAGAMMEGADLDGTAVTSAEQMPESEKKTSIMNTVDQELLEQLTRDPNELDAIVRSTGEHEIVDDGQRTTAMDAVDPAALGLDVASSGSFPASDDDGEEDDGPEGNGNGNGGAATTGSADKKRGKRRKKRR